MTKEARIYTGEKTASSINGVGKTESYMLKNQNWPTFSLQSDTTERLHFHFSLSCVGEGNGSLLQYYCLENPRDRGAWRAAIYGVTQSRTRLKQLSGSSSSDPVSFFCKWLSSFPTTIYWKDCSLSIIYSWLCLKITDHVGIFFFCALYSIPLTEVSFCLPVPYCFKLPKYS